MKKKIGLLLVVVFILLGILSLLDKKDYGTYSLDKNLIAQISSNNPNYVTIDKIPLNLKNAVIAVEDTRFYKHLGFDVISISRAVVVNIKSGYLKEGGSTLTQQLAKNLFLSREKKFSRKLEELYIAIRLESMYDKDEILEMYLNAVYFGSGAYGIGSASKLYFGKEPQSLSLEECAMLAGLLKAPSLYNPRDDYKTAKERQEVVLTLMEKHGFIEYTQPVMNTD